jgi:GAF domain-containing protein
VPPVQNSLIKLQRAIGPLVGPITTAGLVIIFVFFVLLEPSDLRDRFIRLAGSDLHRTTEALGEAAHRVSRYLLMQLIVNATYAIPLGIGLYLIGVPGAFLWALLAAFLRFIPYLGPFIAALFPLTMAFVVDPGWNMLLWSAALILTIELISNNVIEPWLYGTSTGLTPVAVILSAIFWTLLWGPVGLVLATPLTVCLVVMGRYVPQLAFMEVLLGSEPVLQPEERLYQRLLAGNVEEAIEIAETHVADQAPYAFYEQVGVPALRLAENARQQGTSPYEHQKIADGMMAIIQDLKDQTGRKEGNAPSKGKAGSDAMVLCIAGRSVLDMPAAAMLRHALEEKGIDAHQVPPSAVALDAIGKLDLAGIDIVCVLYLTPMPKAYARFVCRRLKRRMPQLKIVLGLLNLAVEADMAEKLAAEAGADAAASTFAAALQQVESMLARTATPSTQPPPLPDYEKARLEALQSSGILAAGKSAHLDRVARKLADAFETPIGLVTLIDDSCQLWKGAAGLPEDLERTRQGSRDTSICTHVVANDAPLVVEDTTLDPRFASNPFLRERQIRFYAGVPLRTASGYAIGSLCIIDHKPRTLSGREIRLLQVIADELMADLARQAEAVARYSDGEDEFDLAENAPEFSRLRPTAMNDKRP